MRYSATQSAVGAAIVLLSFSPLPCAARHGHGHQLSHLDVIDRRHSHQRIHASPRAEAPAEKRQSQCEFPTDMGLVAVTPDSSNAGWAMSPDQTCIPDSFCPFACPPGQVMNQWNPLATSYPSPLSMVRSSIFGKCLLLMLV